MTPRGHVSEVDVARFAVLAFTAGRIETALLDSAKLEAGHWPLPPVIIDSSLYVQRLGPLKASAIRNRSERAAFYELPPSRRALATLEYLGLPPFPMSVGFLAERVSGLPRALGVRGQEAAAYVTAAASLARTLGLGEGYNGAAAVIEEHRIVAVGGPFGLVPFYSRGVFLAEPVSFVVPLPKAAPAIHVDVRHLRELVGNDTHSGPRQGRIDRKVIDLFADAGQPLPRGAARLLRRDAGPLVRRRLGELESEAMPPGARTGAEYVAFTALGASLLDLADLYGRDPSAISRAMRPFRAARGAA
jgi:hypothetical protein